MSKGNRTRRRELGLLPEPVKCSARRSDGQPCGNSPVKGATVCRKHGGASPQVKRKAQERLLEGVPKMLRMLRQIAEDESQPANVRLAAIRDWLDRAGIDRKIEIEVSPSSSFEDLVAGAIASIDDVGQITNGTDYADRLNVVAGEVVDDRAVDPFRLDDDRARLPQPSLPTAPYRNGRS